MDDQVIATRPLAWQDAAGNMNQALVQIGLPFANPRQPGNATWEGPWGCRVQVQGLDDNVCYTMFGEDSIEALATAIVFGGTIVTNSSVAAGLNWAILPNCGFPTFPTPPAAAGTGGGGGVVAGGAAASSIRVGGGKKKPR